MIKEYGSSFELSESKGTGIKIVDNEKKLFFRSAREALLCLCDNLECKTVILPSLCCDSMIQPFRIRNFKILFYDITDKMEIDYISLKKVLEPNSLLLIMHYYGIESFEEKKLDEIIHSYDNIKIVQDCTQNIFDKDLYSSLANFFIGSIRKWIAIPDGAFLISNSIQIYNNSNVEDQEYVKKIYKAMQLKYEYLKSFDYNLKIQYREIFKWGMDYLKKEISFPCKISTISKKIISEDIDIESVIEKRRKNYNKLYELIKKQRPEVLKYAKSQYAPLCLPIMLDERDDIQKEMANNNIYCQVLWPISKDIFSKNGFNQWFSNHMLAIPCDQRYDESDMEVIANTLLKILEKYE